MLNHMQVHLGDAQPYSSPSKRCKQVHWNTEASTQPSRTLQTWPHFSCIEFFVHTPSIFQWLGSHMSYTQALLSLWKNTEPIKQKILIHLEFALKWQEVGNSLSPVPSPLAQKWFLSLVKFPGSLSSFFWQSCCVPDICKITKTRMTT